MSEPLTRPLTVVRSHRVTRMAFPATASTNFSEPTAACVDGWQCDERDLEISERGMRFISQWRFTIGTQLDVLVRHMHPRLGLCQLHLEGIVVWSEPRSAKGCETTLLFLELPDEIRPALREFSHRAPARA